MNGGNCTEVDHRRARQQARRHRPGAWSNTPDAWHAFLGGARLGEFGELSQPLSYGAVHVSFRLLEDEPFMSGLELAAYHLIHLRVVRVVAECGSDAACHPHQQLRQVLTFSTGHRQ